MADRSDLMRYPPPFTPGGRASFDRPHPSDPEDGLKQTRYWQSGIVCRWRTERANAEVLLPSPLEPVADTDRPYLLLLETQAGRSDAHLADEHPALTNWHEATFLIPCAFRGVPSMFHWVSYKDADLDYQIILGAYQGLTTKLATFAKTFPLASQKLNSEMKAGGIAQMVLSRFNERIITAGFMAEQEVRGSEAAEVLDLARVARVVGIRFMPDFHTAGEPAPLVHDLVRWERGDMTLSRAWRGDAQVLLGRSDDEELYLLDPLGDLDAFFVHLAYRTGSGTVIHDYVQPKER
jgi:hypothetical protein